MVAPPQPHGPIPAPRQLRWHRHELYGFLHFGINTFTDKEWGYGDEAPALFDPSAFDADQMAAIAAQAGLAGLILTCKHHDGFCLWPSRYTEHSVKNSPWKGGKGDVVGEVAEACRRHGILFGAYLSPWDRNHAEYGQPGYVEYYRQQLEELTTEYGELFEVWFDGANGGDGYYGGARQIRRIDRRTYYDWPETWQIVRQNQPEAVMFSDAGPDIRWVGNEKGIAGDPCWSTLSTEALYPGFGGDWQTGFEPDLVKAWASDQEMLNRGDPEGGGWLPAECDVSIRPGWFYHAAEDDKVRSADNLLDLYMQSVGRGASLLLNLPPDRRGQLHDNDVKSLLAFRRRRQAIFGRDLASGAQATASTTRGGDARFAPGKLLDGDAETYWATDDGQTDAEVVLELPAAVTFNRVRLGEYLPLGQRVDRFAVEIDRGGQWVPFAAGQAIGHCRLLAGKNCTTSRVRLRLMGARACPALRQMALYRDAGG